MIIYQLVSREEEIKEFNQLAALVSAEEPTVTPVTTPEGETIQVITTRNLDPLFAENPDCIGWIFIEGTTVNYPVMHTPQEPEKYLRKSFYGKRSTAGVPFLEGLCIRECDHLVIYGHNMKNGTMFADLANYISQDYRNDHPRIELETDAGLKTYTVFAVARIKQDDDWYSFHDAPSEAEYTRQISYIQSKALYDTGAVPQYGQQLLTLSTCYGSNKKDRIIVVGFESNS